MKCRCRWRWTSDGLCLKCHDKLQLRGCGLSSTLLFFLSSLLLFSALGILFAWLAFPPFQHRPLDGKGIAGCQPDNEGSWAIGVYSGKSPFSLEPLEMVLLIFLFSLSLKQHFFFCFVVSIGTVTVTYSSNCIPFIIDRPFPKVFSRVW